MNHGFRAFLLTMEYFGTMGDMTMRNLGNMRVLLLKANYTYLSFILYLILPKMMR